MKLTVDFYFLKNNIPTIVRRRILLVNDYIISSQYKGEVEFPGEDPLAIPVHEKQKYILVFLNKYDTNLASKGFDCIIVVEDYEGIEHEWLLKLNFLQKLLIRWMNKWYWVQKEENFKWIVPLIISIVGLITALIALFRSS